MAKLWAMDLYDTLKNRGFIYQCTDEDAVRKLFNDGPVTLYVGYDATADSLHIGSCLTLMALKHIQSAGHKVIILVGGATTLIGDPTDRTDLRKMLTTEQINDNVKGIRQDIAKYIDFEGDNPAQLVNNLDWLGGLNYLTFLREYGTKFSVNRMVNQESVKQRMNSDSGMTFLEFNYSLLQAFDFMHLNKEYGCQLQLGGSDQWGNVVAGIDLTRRQNQQEVFGLTFPLVTTASGGKMGKSADGAVWLRSEKRSPYDFYQYWINVDDRDVVRFLKFFTLLPLDKIAELSKVEGKEINDVKKILAWEATALCHGEDEANKARETTKKLFEEKAAGGGENAPSIEIESSRLGEVTYLDLFVETGLCASRGDARRQAKGGATNLNDKKLGDLAQKVGTDDFTDNALMLRLGKKKYYRVVLKT